MSGQKEWTKYIMRAEKRMNKYGRTIIRNAASENSISLLKEWISRNVSKDLWINEYEEFLKIQNGFRFNGLIFYGTIDYENNLIRENEAWDWQGESFEHRYLFLGDVDISWYVFDIKENCFEELDKPSGSLVKKYSDFDSMFLSALQSRISF